MGNPYPLKQNAGKSFQGSIVLGKGFVLTPEEAEALIAKDPRNKDVLFPYLNGDDLNNDPEQKPSRWVINFFDWSEEKAHTYPDCFEIVERLVKPERNAYDETKNSWNKSVRTNWWLFGAWRKGLDETISKLDQVMVVPLVSKYLSIDFVPTSYVYMHKLGIIASNDFQKFGILSSALHNAWCWKNSSTLGAGTLNYSTTDCFGTFPFPLNLSDDLKNISEGYYLFRKNFMKNIQMGLTKTYNQLHSVQLAKTGENPTLKKHLSTISNGYSLINAHSDIIQLQNLQRNLDNIALKSYGWSDIQLKHDFYEMDYLPENDRVRFTIHPDARKEILKRLLKLNHKLYQAESTNAQMVRLLDKKIKIGKDNNGMLF
jgi:hypothetical protein